MNTRQGLLSVTAAIGLAAAPQANAAEYQMSCILGALIGASAGYGLYATVAAGAVGAMAVPVGLGVVVVSGAVGCNVAAQAFGDNSRLPGIR